MIGNPGRWDAASIDAGDSPPPHAESLNEPVHRAGRDSPSAAIRCLLALSTAGKQSSIDAAGLRSLHDDQPWMAGWALMPRLPPPSRGTAQAGFKARLFEHRDVRVRAGPECAAATRKTARSRKDRAAAVCGAGRGEQLRSQAFLGVVCRDDRNWGGSAVAAPLLGQRPKAGPKPLLIFLVRGAAGDMESRQASVRPQRHAAEGRARTPAATGGRSRRDLPGSDSSWRGLRPARPRSHSHTRSILPHLLSHGTPLP
jgi:hypothetical protein